MTSATFSTSSEAQQAAALLDGYHFELGGHDARQWVSLWLEFYRPSWIRDAVIEALYQGRYKSVSVRQILEMWQRRAKPIRHVTHDFEAAVCREFGEVKIAPTATVASNQHRTKFSGSQLAKKRSSLTRSSQPPTNRPPEKQYAAMVSGARNGHSGGSGLPKRLHASSSVSFNLAELAAAERAGATDYAEKNYAETGGEVKPPAGLAESATTRYSDRYPKRHVASAESTGDSAIAANATTAAGTECDKPLGQRPDKHSDKHLDNRAWREFPTYTTPTYTHKTESADEELKAQREFNSVLYSSARAIQPFKPALPFSAKTLRLAKQRAASSN
ncbi:MAG: hypothetical protein AAGJ80_05135 [Cyanobacteria bacterium J06553_1]